MALTGSTYRSRLADPSASSPRRTLRARGPPGVRRRDVEHRGARVGERAVAGRVRETGEAPRGRRAARAPSAASRQPSAASRGPGSRAADAVERVEVLARPPADHDVRRAARPPDHRAACRRASVRRQVVQRVDEGEPAGRGVVPRRPGQRAARRAGQRPPAARPGSGTSAATRAGGVAGPVAERTRSGRCRRRAPSRATMPARRPAPAGAGPATGRAARPCPDHRRRGRGRPRPLRPRGWGPPGSPRSSASGIAQCRCTPGSAARAGERVGPGDAA